MATVTAGHPARPRSRFALASPPLTVGLGLGVLTGGIVITLLYGFSLTLTLITVTAIPVLYALNAIVWRANNYLILHPDRVDLKIWELGDFGPGLRIPYERISAVRVHPTADLLQIRYLYDDEEEPATATVEMRTRDDALFLASEITHRRNDVRAVLSESA